jgi:dihydroorotase
VHHFSVDRQKVLTLGLKPPLNRIALQKELDNTIDMITSDHKMDIEHKKMEFDMAKDGTIGTRKCFCALMTVLPLEKCRKINFGKNSFSIESHSIEEGA